MTLAALALADESPQNDSPAPQPWGMSEGKARVMVVDDSITIRTLAKELLEPAYECLLVENGVRALETVESFRPDVIISDVMMAGMDGLQLCRKLRERPETAGIPFVLLTSIKGEEERAKGLELGADDYLYKPIRPRELVARVASLTRLRRASLSLEQRTLELEAKNRELKAAQEALIRSEKLATVGTLAGGVAHEINNPLAFMMSGCSTLKAMLKDLEKLGEGQAQERKAITDELVEIGDEVMEGLDRIARIVRDLKEFSSDRSRPAERANLAEEIERAWKMSTVRAKRRPEVKIEVAEEVRQIRVVRQLLGQTLLNVFINAVQALAEKDGVVNVRARAVDGERVAIEIEDNGPGIAREHLSRVFDPFFTTKPPGHGTGLGLSVAYGAVRTLGGDIDVRSPPGSGAIFTVTLPIEAAEETGPALGLGLKQK